jgi:hypothetical protein
MGRQSLRKVTWNLEWSIQNDADVRCLSVTCCVTSLLLSTIELVCIRLCCCKSFRSFSWSPPCQHKPLPLLFTKFVVFGMLRWCSLSSILTFHWYDCGLRSSSLSWALLQFGQCKDFVYIGRNLLPHSEALLCATPKPLPWIKRLRPEDHDGCLYCGKKKEDHWRTQRKEKQSQSHVHWPIFQTILMMRMLRLLPGPPLVLELPL